MTPANVKRPSASTRPPPLVQNLAARSGRHERERERLELGGRRLRALEDDAPVDGDAGLERQRDVEILAAHGHVGRGPLRRRVGRRRRAPPSDDRFDRVRARRDAGEHVRAVGARLSGQAAQARAREHLRLRAGRHEPDREELGKGAGRRADRPGDGRRRHELNRDVHAGALLAQAEGDRRRRADVGRAGMKDRRVVHARRLTDADGDGWPRRGRRGRGAGASRLQRLLHLVRRQLADVVVAPPRRDGWRDDHEIAARGQAVGAVLAAIVGHARAAGARRAERALAGHRVVAKLQHPHVHARHGPAAHVAHDAGDHAAARDRHREIRDRLAVFHDDGRARAVRPRRAVAGSEIGVLERLQLEPARRQAAKRERAAVVGGRRLTRRACARRS